MVEISPDAAAKSAANCSSGQQRWRSLLRPASGLFRPIIPSMSNVSGATAVEFAMVAPVLMLILTGIVEFGLVLAADIVLKNATSDASRTGRTGFSAQDSTQDATVRRMIRSEAGVLMDADRITIESAAYSGFDALKKPEPFVDANKNGRRDNGENFTDVNGNGVYDIDQGRSGYGGTSEVVVYTVSYPWRFFTPIIGRMVGTDGVLTLTATAVVQNEPY